MFLVHGLSLPDSVEFNFDGMILTKGGECPSKAVANLGNVITLVWLTIEINIICPQVSRQF